MDEEILIDIPEEKVVFRSTQLPPEVKDAILDHIYDYASERAIPMNVYPQQFNIDRLENFVSLFSKLESNEWVRCNGNYGWLGSRDNGVLLDLSHPHTQFTCQMLPQGIAHVQEKRNKQQEEEVEIIERTSGNKVPWYDHWIFWLICVAAFMAMMIGMVELHKV